MSKTSANKNINNIPSRGINLQITMSFKLLGQILKIKRHI